MKELKEYKHYHRDDEWSKEELKKIRELYPCLDKTIEDITSELPGRTQNAIRLKAHRLGLIRPFILNWMPDSTICPHCGHPLKETQI